MFSLVKLVDVSGALSTETIGKKLELDGECGFDFNPFAPLATAVSPTCDHAPRLATERAI